MGFPLDKNRPHTLARGEEYREMTDICESFLTLYGAWESRPFFDFHWDWQSGGEMSLHWDNLCPIYGSMKVSSPNDPGRVGLVFTAYMGRKAERKGCWDLHLYEGGKTVLDQTGYTATVPDFSDVRDTLGRFIEAAK
jgi:hypothetical protein